MKFIHIIWGFLMVTLVAAQSQEQVQIPSSLPFNGEALALRGWFFLAPSTTTDPKPQAAVLLLHGCGGAYDAKGQLSSKMVEYAHLLNEQGWHALVLDSLSTRGEKQICTQPYSKRIITPMLRAQDVLDAHRWLTEQVPVDPHHIAYLGWSNGGSTVLSATNLNNSFVSASPLKPVAASAFYPGCVQDLRMGYRPSTDLLIQIGDSDDWTHPGPCKDMVAQSANPKPEIIAYSGAYHQFDSAQEVKIRYDVGSGKGVHYGGNSAANSASKHRLIEFLNNALKHE